MRERERVRERERERERESEREREAADKSLIIPSWQRPDMLLG